MIVVVVVAAAAVVVVVVVAAAGEVAAVVVLLLPLRLVEIVILMVTVFGHCRVHLRTPICLCGRIADLT